jgi:hypothetical protein
VGKVRRSEGWGRRGGVHEWGGEGEWSGDEMGGKE